MATAAIGAAIVLAPTGAGAQSAPSVVATGWWSRSPLASAPAGGMAVGATPDGPTSVAAIKLELGAGVTNAVVALEEVSATGAELGVVIACESKTDWAPVEKGALEDAPRSSCATSPSVPVTRDSATLTWSVDLTRMVEGRTGQISVALVPAAIPQTAAAGGVAAFDVQWSGPPTLEATPVAVSSAATTATTPPAADDSAPVAAAAPASTPAAVTPAAPTFNVTPAAVPTPVLQVETPPTSSEIPTTSVAPISRGLAGGAESGSSDPDRPFAQAAFFIVVAGMAGTIAGVGRWYATSR